MAEPSSGNEEEKEVAKVNSFTKILRGSPASDTSPKKKSSNPLTKFLRRKSSRKGNDDGGEDSSLEVVDSEPIEEEEEELEKDQSIVEEVKEVVETAFQDLIHRKKSETSNEHKIGESRDESFSETKGSKRHHFIGKLKEGYEKGKEGLKEEYGKAKDEFKARLQKEKSEDEHHQQHPVEIPNEHLHEHHQQHPIEIPNEHLHEHHHEQKSKPDINEDTPIDEVKAPNLAQRIQEEVIAIVSTIDSSKKDKSPSQEEHKEVKQEIKEEKKEDNCITALAQGLQNFCSWGSKKEH